MTAAPPTGRPVQHSTLTQLAQFMALLDPRCGFEEHNVIVKLPYAPCPRCHLDLKTYRDALPQDWPTP